MNIGQAYKKLSLIDDLIRRCDDFLTNVDKGNVMLLPHEVSDIKGLLEDYSKMLKSIETCY